MNHDRPAAHIAVRAKQLLPQVLDAGRIFTIEELEQRLGQGGRDLGLTASDFAPTRHVGTGLDFEVGLGADRACLEAAVMRMAEPRSSTAWPGASPARAIPVMARPPAAAIPMVVKASRRSGCDDS